MKKAFYMAMAAALLCFSACDIVEFGENGNSSKVVANEETRLAPESQFVAPKLVALSDITIDQNTTDETVNFVWEPADFGAPVQILYSLYLTTGANPVLAGTSFGQSLSLTKSDINGLVIKSLSGRHYCLPRGEDRRDRRRPDPLRQHDQLQRHDLQGQTELALHLRPVPERLGCRPRSPVLGDRRRHQGLQDPHRLPCGRHHHPGRRPGLQDPDRAQLECDPLRLRRPQADLGLPG